MSSNSEFSELAYKTIKTYYQEFAGSLQNTSHSKALLYSQKIERLRQNFLSYLGLDRYFLSFQPNKHYLERVIFNFLDSQSNCWDIFTNRTDLKIEGSCLYDLEGLLSLKELKNPTFVLMDSQSVNSSSISEVNKKLSYFKSQSKQSIYSYLASKNLNLLRENDLKDFSFISYDPSEELSEFGTTFFAFQQGLELNPVFLGSGGAKFDHKTKEIKLRELPHLLEIGTQSLVSWIVLAEYFEKLCQVKQALALYSIKNVN